jgi:hypothetical protein
MIVRVPRGWRVLICAAVLLAGASVFLSAWLFSGLRDVSLQGCERQNRLRHELNVTLQSFHQPPRFEQVDCPKAYKLRFPF